MMWRGIEIADFETESRSLSRNEPGGLVQPNDPPTRFANFPIHFS
jgi:hypothetical protein